MMYVFGELSEPNEETVVLVEEIVRNQMIETITLAVQQAAKRGSRFLSTEDIIFLIRHDRPKVNRLRTFLSWKDVRKNVKDNKEGPPVEEEIMDDQDKTAKVRKMKVKFSWDYLNAYTNILSDDDDDEADDEDRQAYEDQAARLRLADSITSTMTKEEYMYYSECRQASFTFKKVKRFREWCEMAKYYENKAPSDVLDIMGFLAYEIVSKITETGLAVKKEWDREKKLEELRSNRGMATMDVFLFDKPSDVRTPLQPAHIQEAFRRLQAASMPLSNFGGKVRHRRLCLI
ncbi:Transcription initiation protein spt3, variant 2 [Batrachochytrium dendrobatidis]|nr:Transcription initiation protein spt3, variant 2 [Batrachochytrium dendrobatidis]KAK5671174.1 Transcription initiation protein spt3, variant 2 [Batrachochytrium dendrobatidis]